MIRLLFSNTDTVWSVFIAVFLREVLGQIAEGTFLEIEWTKKPLPQSNRGQTTALMLNSQSSILKSPSSILKSPNSIFMHAVSSGADGGGGNCQRRFLIQ